MKGGDLRQAPDRGVGPRRLLACLIALGLILPLGACGGAGENEGEPARTVADRPAPPASEFPAAAGRTLGEVVAQADPPRPDDPVVTPAVQVFYPGENRYSFLLADRDHEQITDADVALYLAPVRPAGKAGGAYEQPASGPFPARLVSLATEPEFRSRSTAESPFSALAFYLAEPDFPVRGEWRVEALIRYRGRLIAKSLPRAAVGVWRGIPTAGERPPRISTPTVSTAADAAAELSTRRPPGDLNEANFAEALGEKPVALLFTTPAFCESRICSPVADVAEQVASEFGDRVEVIHMEIYNGNDPDLGVRPQVRRFNLPSDTWLFVAGADGKLVAAVEGPFAAGEMRRWLEEADRG